MIPNRQSITARGHRTRLHAKKTVQWSSLRAAHANVVLPQELIHGLHLCNQNTVEASRILVETPAFSRRFWRLAPVSSLSALSSLTSSRASSNSASWVLISLNAWASPVVHRLFATSRIPQAPPWCNPQRPWASWAAHLMPGRVAALLRS